MTTFTKSIFAVELNGKPYAIALPAEKVLELIAIAAKMSDDGKLDLMPVPNGAFFSLAMMPAQIAADQQRDAPCDCTPEERIACKVCRTGGLIDQSRKAVASCSALTDEQQ